MFSFLFFSRYKDIPPLYYNNNNRELMKYCIQSTQKYINKITTDNSNSLVNQKYLTNNVTTIENNADKRNKFMAFFILSISSLSLYFMRKNK